MVTSTHSKRDHHPLLEGTLWLIWLTVRWVAPAGRAVKRVVTTAAASIRAAGTRVTAAIRRALHRLDLALTGPVRNQFGVAGTKLRDRSTILLVAGLMLANLLWLALR